jgi:hypothetical protein
LAKLEADQELAVRQASATKEGLLVAAQPAALKAAILQGVILRQKDPVVALQRRALILVLPADR